MLSNPKKFKSFFQEYFEPIFRFVRRYTEDDALARDIVQDTFIRLYERRMDFDSIEKAKSFAYTTAHNLCLDYFRHRKIELQYSQSFSTEEEQDTFLHEITYQETLHILHNAIRELPPQTREIILQGLNGNNNNEIAVKLGISVNTVKTLKKSAYKTLRNTLKNDSIFMLVLLTVNAPLSGHKHAYPRSAEDSRSPD